MDFRAICDDFQFLFRNQHFKLINYSKNFTIFFPWKFSCTDALSDRASYITFFLSRDGFWYLFLHYSYTSTNNWSAEPHTKCVTNYGSTNLHTKCVTNDWATERHTKCVTNDGSTNRHTKRVTNNRPAHTKSDPLSFCNIFSLESSSFLFF